MLPALLQAAPAPPPIEEPNTLMIWGLVLLGSAVAMLVAEMFLPSGGLISIAAAGCTVGGLVCLFFTDTTLGALATLGVLIATPFIAGFMLQYWPHTPIGRALILASGAEEGDEEVPRTRPLDAAQQAHPDLSVGDVGSTRTPLRPVGTCVFGGKRIECLAEARMIESGCDVRIVDIDGSEVRVRAVS